LNSTNLYAPIAYRSLRPKPVDTELVRHIQLNLTHI
ncbi:MAG: hypothetical protein RLZZ419_1602, partial [Pseudomonadota bacterium]